MKAVSPLPCITCSPTNTSALYTAPRSSTSPHPRYSDGSASRLFSCFAEILLSVLMIKKLKRRQLPPSVLMCSRNNSSQSRPELQSVLGVPVRQNPCSGVLYKVSRAADVSGTSRLRVFFFLSNL